ncbi:MAG: threonylcarbamoyl-AMP synthase [Bacteroidetes bacterium]|nr:threonylcarbamoyl-AMP synthase [Rhodothermaceae bacterium RA]RMH59913.1 MAG: threonylcarbamoyl-AMP synthase [Bacteroidota bacterium]
MAKSAFRSARTPGDAPLPSFLAIFPSEPEPRPPLPRWSLRLAGVLEPPARPVQTLLTPSPTVAATFIRRGELVAFPTETVYGLGADALDPEAVRRIFEAKGRPGDNPLIVHVAHPAQVDALAAECPPAARALMEAFFPGPLTLVLPRHPAVPAVVSGGLETIGVRMPDHALARAFLEACGRPVAAPSANRSGRPSPTTWEAVYEDLAGRIACILQGGPTQAGLESTVVDVTGPIPLVLRAGVVTLEQLRQVVPAVRLARTGPELARSPGTRYRHYAPHAPVHLIDTLSELPPDPDAAYIGLQPVHAGPALALSIVCTDVRDYAHRLFDFFRRCDARGVSAIYCQRVPPDGLGLALMDRLQRAAAR